MFPGDSPWGGYLLRGAEGDQENQILGQLIDLYGPSKLEGILDKDTLRFRKQYERCNSEQVFDYEFSFKNGIWQGKYSSPRGYSGKSICKINLFLGNLRIERVDLRTPEGYARALVQRMLELGSLETLDDSGNGRK